MTDNDEILANLVIALAENEGIPPEMMENLDMSNPKKILQSESIADAIKDEENGN